MQRLSISLLPAAMALLIALGTIADVTLPERVTVKGQQLVLNGMALRKKFFIKVYVGGLYLAQKETSAGRILAADSPRRMVMHFIYDVSKNQMCDAWNDGLEDNTPNAGADVKRNFQTLCGWMEGVGSGKELVLTYIPGAGTQVEIAGKLKGTIAGKATADAILNCWLGPDPAPGESFKNAVLGTKD